MNYGFFRIVQWDLLLLFSKIVSMQFCAYSGLGAVLLLANYISNENLAASSLFRYDVLRISKLEGRITFCVFVLSSMLSAMLLWLIVKRAKLCLDFSFTYHGFHLIICLLYNAAFPSHLTWWLINIITSSIMCIGGEFLCLKSELRIIPVGYSINNSKSDV